MKLFCKNFVIFLKYHLFSITYCDISCNIYEIFAIILKHPYRFFLKNVVISSEHSSSSTPCVTWVFGWSGLLPP